MTIAEFKSEFGLVESPSMKRTITSKKFIVQQRAKLPRTLEEKEADKTFLTTGSPNIVSYGAMYTKWKLPESYKGEEYTHFSEGSGPLNVRITEELSDALEAGEHVEVSFYLVEEPQVSSDGEQYFKVRLRKAHYRAAL